MRTMLVMIMLMFGTAATAHPHHDCPKEDPQCDKHTHPGGGPK